jgi:hypothetical protein
MSTYDDITYPFLSFATISLHMAMTDSFRAKELLAPMCALASDRVANVRLAVARFFSVYRNASTIGASEQKEKGEKEKEANEKPEGKEKEKPTEESPVELSEEHKAALQRLRVLFFGFSFFDYCQTYHRVRRPIGIGTFGITSHIVRA